MGHISICIILYGFVWVVGGDSPFDLGFFLHLCIRICVSVTCKLKGWRLPFIISCTYIVFYTKKGQQL